MSTNPKQKISILQDKSNGFTCIYMHNYLLAWIGSLKNHSIHIFHVETSLVLLVFRTPLKHDMQYKVIWQSTCSKTVLRRYKGCFRYNTQVMHIIHKTSRYWRFQTVPLHCTLFWKFSQNSHSDSYSDVDKNMSEGIKIANMLQHTQIWRI